MRGITLIISFIDSSLSTLNYTATFFGCGSLCVSTRLILPTCGDCLKCPSLKAVFRCFKTALLIFSPLYTFF